MGDAPATKLVKIRQVPFCRLHWYTLGVLAVTLGCWPKSGYNPSNYDYRYLVGGLEHVFFLRIVGIVIPIDFHIFQRGWNRQPDILRTWTPTGFQLVLYHFFVPKTAWNGNCALTWTSYQHFLMVNICFRWVEFTNYAPIIHNASSVPFAWRAASRYAGYARLNRASVIVHASAFTDASKDMLLFL